MRYLILAILIALTLPVALFAESIRPSFNYQGRLIEDGTPANGTRSIQFTIFRENTLLWRSDPMEMQVHNGLYSIIVSGFDPAILNEKGLDLEVRVGDTPAAMSALSPRTRLLPSLQASMALDTAPDSVDAESIVDGSITSAKIQTGQINADHLAASVQRQLESLPQLSAIANQISSIETELAEGQQSDLESRNRLQADVNSQLGQLVARLDRLSLSVSSILRRVERLEARNGHTLTREQLIGDYRFSMLQIEMDGNTPPLPGPTGGDSLDLKVFTAQGTISLGATTGSLSFSNSPGIHYRTPWQGPPGTPTPAPTRSEVVDPGGSSGGPWSLDPTGTITFGGVTYQVLNQGTLLVGAKSSGDVEGTSAFIVATRTMTSSTP